MWSKVTINDEQMRRQIHEKLGDLRLSNGDRDRNIERLRNLFAFKGATVVLSEEDAALLVKYMGY